MAKQLMELILDDITIHSSNDQKYALGDLFADILHNIAVTAIAKNDPKYGGQIFNAMVTLIKDFKKNYYQKFAEVSRLVADASKSTTTEDITEDVAVKDNGLRPKVMVVDDPQETPTIIDKVELQEVSQMSDGSYGVGYTISNNTISQDE